MASTVYVINDRSISFLTRWVAAVSDHVHKSLGMAMIEATELAYEDAVRRAKAQFNNTPGYVRSGGLMNAIYRGFDRDKGVGFLGVQSPYGRIQEEGGEVRPVNARHLWVKNWLNVPSEIRRMTPREWMAAHKADPRHYPFLRRLAAYSGDGKKITPMFRLADKVEIPARPYIRPAVEMAYAQLPALLTARLARSAPT